MLGLQSAHEHLKNRDALHMCFGCSRYWVASFDFSAFSSEAECEAALDRAMAGFGLKPGDSTIGKAGEPGQVVVLQFRARAPITCFST